MEETILTVDDDKDIRDVLAISLTDLGYKVLTAENGEDALRIFREANPPIILTDIRMPVMDGIELLQKVKQQSPDTEVIMVTGHGEVDLAIESLKYEATDFITKPFSDEILETALRRARERIDMRAKLKAYTANLESIVHELLGLSHTIKTIAGGLEGGSFVLEKGLELDEKEYMLQGWEMIRMSVEKVKDLSLALLNHAKATHRNYRRCDPNQPARDVFELLKSRAEQEGVDLRLECQRDLDPLDLDQEGINCCLHNLVTNALDAIAERDPRDRERWVSIKTTKPDGWGVEYQVADNGSGIVDEIKDRIFTSFCSTKGARGTGAGLMMTKRIIEDHKGLIQFDSKRDAGTTFIVRLPKIGPHNASHR
jgi:signal transduction histidine kinase